MAETSLKKSNRKLALNALMALGAFVICVVTAMVSSIPDTYDLAQGDIAPETITAPEDFVDEAATQRLIEEEQAKVGPVYTINRDISKQIIQQVNDDFTAIGSAQAYAESLYTEQQQEIQQQVQQTIEETEKANAQATTVPSAPSETTDDVEATTTRTPTPSPVRTPYEIPAFVPANVDWESLLTQENIDVLMEMLPAYMDEDDLMTVITTEQADLDALQSALTGNLQSTVDAGIASEDVDAVKTKMIADMAWQLSLAQKNMLGKVVSNDVQPNLEFDEEETQDQRNEAAKGLIKEYKRGENIVEKGNRVTAEQYELLKERGLLSSESTSLYPYAAITMYIGMLFIMYTVFLAIFNKRLLRDTKKVAILCILTALSYVTTALAQLISIHIFPIILFVILGAVLLSPKNALVYSVFLSLLLTSVTTNGHDFFSRESLDILLMTLIGSFFAVFMLKDMRLRARLILAGVVSVIPGVVIEIMKWQFHLVNTQNVLVGVGIMAISGLLCGIASIGVLPIIENLFKLTTPTKLLEISTPSHPLLQRLMVEAPGTYHHSVLVANLADAASNAVGGYSLLARVGAYFHDVGKLENPLFFKENQRNNFNPHDNFSPWESAAIILRHTTDGVALLRKHKMPLEIITIAREHHGNSLAAYFYAEALQTGEKVDEKDFRYDGIPPTTKEGAIIMLADIVEAAVRSLDNPSREDIEATVHRLIKDRYDDGQLDNAPLNRADLNEIATSFINIFSGVYHQRIKYPQIKIHGEADEDNVL